MHMSTEVVGAGLGAGSCNGSRFANKLHEQGGAGCWLVSSECSAATAQLTLLFSQASHTTVWTNWIKFKVANTARKVYSGAKLIKATYSAWDGGMLVASRLMTYARTLGDADGIISAGEFSLFPISFQARQ